MRIPQDVILIWTGTNSSIPSGWTRETSLDDKYPKAWGTQNPNTTGGSATHSHTSSGHTHTIIDHSHTVSFSNPNSGSSNKDTAAVGGAPADSHSHNASTSSGVTGGTVSNTGTITWSSVNHEPPYFKVIFIKAGLSSLLQQGIITLWDKQNLPSNWQECNGANGSPDLRGKYIKGAGVGEDAGGTGGALTHNHTSSHSHTISHYHTGNTGSATNQNQRGTSSGGANDASKDWHGHSFTTNTVNETSTTYNATSDNQSNEPEYKKLVAIQFKNGAIKEKGIIGLWLGDVNNIPKGWVLCDGQNGTLDLRDKFIKIANTPSEVGQIGGSNTHSHNSVTHSHTATTSHSHSGTTENNSTADYFNGSGSLSGIRSHTHPFSTNSITTSLNNSNIPATSSSDNQPPYRTVAYIQFQKEIYGGAILTNFI